MKAKETERFFGLEFQMMKNWQVRSKKKELKKLGRLLEIISIERVKKILERDEEYRTDEDIVKLFKVQQRTLNKYPLFSEFLRKISNKDFQLFCIIDEILCDLCDEKY